jgi:hypothetical protein
VRSGPTAALGPSRCARGSSLRGLSLDGTVRTEGNDDIAGWRGSRAAARGKVSHAEISLTLKRLSALDSSCRINQKKGWNLHSEEF